MTQTSMEDGSWIKEEISQVNFNDIRLDRRFKSLAAELAARPSFPINQATSDWAAAKAAYRFFDNEKIQAEKILEPHYLSTQLRMQGHQHIFIVQDSSTIDFSRHKKTTGLGHLTTLGEAIRWIAMQGGFLGRKNDGEPGQITVWRGWLELAPAAEMWELLNGA